MVVPEKGKTIESSSLWDEGLYTGFRRKGLRRWPEGKERPEAEVQKNGGEGGTSPRVWVSKQVELDS